jgi:hypothetical protein
MQTIFVQLFTPPLDRFYGGDDSTGRRTSFPWHRTNEDERMGIQNGRTIFGNCTYPFSKRRPPAFLFFYSTTKLSTTFLVKENSTRRNMKSNTTPRQAQLESLTSLSSLSLHLPKFGLSLPLLNPDGASLLLS